MQYSHCFYLTYEAPNIALINLYSLNFDLSKKNHPTNDKLANSSTPFSQPQVGFKLNNTNKRTLETKTILDWSNQPNSWTYILWNITFASPYKKDVYLAHFLSRQSEKCIQIKSCIFCNRSWSQRRDLCKSLERKTI